MGVQINERNESVKERLNLFISYSHKDDVYLAELEKHLSLLKRQGLIEPWDDRRIAGGEDWEKEINGNLSNADIVLLLVSSDFISSDYCYSVEMRIALERDNKGEALVIPVIVRAVDWETTPLKRLQAFPQYGKPIAAWDDRDMAFKDVAIRLRQAILKWRTRKLRIPGESTQSFSALSGDQVITRGLRNIAPKNERSGSDAPTKSYLEDGNDPRRNIPPLVNLGKKRESFGWWEIFYALMFGTFLSGINILQRVFNYDSANHRLDLKQILLLNISMGVSAFFLTAAMLLFLSYESEKISLFIKGVARKIIIWYLVAIGFIEVVSHFDSFDLTAKPFLMLVLSHSMFLAVGLIETIIDLKIASCFDKISNHYKEHSLIYRRAGIYALITVVGNFLLALVAVLIFFVSGGPTDEVWTLTLMTILNLGFLVDIRRRIEDVGRGGQRV